MFITLIVFHNLYFFVIIHEIIVTTNSKTENKISIILKFASEYLTTKS